MSRDHILAMLSATLFAGLALAQGAGSAGATQSERVSHATIEAGRQAFASEGCYQCHGYVGQGGEAGPALVKLLISDAAVRDYVRHPRGVMPAFSEKLLPQARLDAIVAYVRALAPGRSPRAIVQLAVYMDGIADTVAEPVATRRTADALRPGVFAAGKTIYAANCAACHGSTLGGGIGPTLRQEGATRTAADIASFIKAAPPPMPRLYPSPLTAADVEAVAIFVHDAYKAPK